MSAITHVRFYPSDWLTGTRGMTAAQMGVYITLIAMMYERCGPISCSDMAKLARLCGTSASAFKGLLDDLISDGKIQRDGDMISNRRAMLEIENVMAKSGVARDKANSRWSKSAEKSMAGECSGNADEMLVSSHKPVDSNISSLRSDTALVAKAPEKPILAKPKSPKPDQEKFEEFWQAYPKRDGSNPKEPARQKFEQAVKRGEDPEAIISAAKSYAEQQKRLGNIGTPYVKQATSWLNAKCWLDDHGTAALVAVSQDANAKAREFLGRLSASQIESYVQRYFVGQFQWNSGQLGPPPDRPGTLIPPDLINRVKQKQEQAA